MQHSQSMESCDASNGEENEFPVDLKDALQTPEILFSHLEDKVNKNLDVTKEVSALKESSRMKDNIIFNVCLYASFVISIFLLDRDNAIIVLIRVPIEKL